MKKWLVFACYVALPFAFLTTNANANDDIPKAAWKRPIGKPLENPGTKKPTLDAGHIDNGFWQGAPVGGFGAGTFSRTYRGGRTRGAGLQPFKDRGDAYGHEYIAPSNRL